MKKKVTIWVKEETRSILKIEAARQGITIVALLEKISRRLRGQDKDAMQNLF